MTLAPDPGQWTCLGSRHDRTGLYGCDRRSGKVLEDVNIDLIFVLFPLEIVPLSDEVTDLHTPRGRAWTTPWNRIACPRV